MEDNIKELKEKNELVLKHFKTKLSVIRTGRANPFILNNIRINYYDVSTPINQLASISTPDAQQLLITPYDPNINKLIVNAINNSDLEIDTPKIEGHVIRIVIPPLTEQRRKELVKQVASSAEQAKIDIRTNRRTANDIIKKSNLTKDEIFQFQDQIQKITDNYIKKIEEIMIVKEKDLMKI